MGGDHRYPYSTYTAPLCGGRVIFCGIAPNFTLQQIHERSFLPTFDCEMNLKRILLTTVMIWTSIFAQGQNKWGFETTVNALLSNKVDTIGSVDLADLQEASHPLMLDARELEEFEVSHIAGAKFVGYDHFDLESLDEMDKDAQIVVYCSVGKRSEEVAAQLMAAGFSQVKNLWGGIFDWTNRGYPVVDMNGNRTDAVHPYNAIWGVWINKCEKSYEPR